MTDFKSKMLAFPGSVKEFYKTLLLYLFSNRKRHITTTKRCVIYLNEKSLFLLYADCTPNLVRIIALEKHPFQTERDLSELVGALSRQYNLKETPISWLLNERDYQLFFLEPMAVPENELRQALSWRLKSSLQKMGETVVDYFKLPSKLGTDNQEMIAAVVAAESSLRSFISVCEKYRLYLQVIDIPELALRNLTSFEENDDKGTALIYIQEGNCILNISKGKTLYLTRRIALHFTNQDNNLKDVALEIIRYFDYFQSYWRHPAPSRIYLIAEKEKENVLLHELSAALAIKIQPFNLQYPIVTSARITDQYWLMIGELFREFDYATTEH